MQKSQILFEIDLVWSFVSHAFAYSKSLFLNYRN